MRLPINLFFFSLLIFFFNPMQPLPLSASSETKLFDLHTLPHGNLTFLGDSHLHGTNAIALTKEGTPTDAPRSTGTVLYSHPISFLDPHLKKVPSFSTMFVFAIKNIYGNVGEFGDGLAFLISPDDNLLGSPGYMGLVDSTDLTKNKFIAVEFDTKCDSLFQDPDNNHLGFDIDNLSSVATSTHLGVNFKSGELIHTWIDYKSHEMSLEVFLSYSDLKPVKSLLKVNIDLSNYLKEKMFVGFSAATEESMQFTCIEQWEFTIEGFSTPPPPSPSPESGRTFPNPFESGQTHSHLSRLAIALIVGICSVPLILVLGWFCWKELMDRFEKIERKNDLDMQTYKSSGEISGIQLSIPDTNPDEVARGFIIEKVLDNEAELIRVKTLNFSNSPPYNSLQY